MSRPELGTVSVGDRLLVIPARYGRTPTEPIEVTVTKVARIWIDMAATDKSAWPRYRLRRDTQHDGGESNYRTRFVTREQYAWEQRLRQVNEYLREAGVDLAWNKPWNTDERRIVLANLMRQHEELPAL
jgi:hypothetical protein